MSTAATCVKRSRQSLRRQAGMASGPSECATIGESSGPLSDTLQQNSNSFSQDAEGGGRGPAMTKSPSVDVDEEMCSLNIGRLRLGQSLPATLLHGRSRTPDPPRRPSYRSEDYSKSSNSSISMIIDSPMLRRQSTVETNKVQKDEEEERVNQYRILDKLGQGAYGVVREAKGSTDEERYAVKIMSKKRLSRIARTRMFGRPPPRGGKPGLSQGRPSTTPQESELLLQVKREIAILKSLDHPNIIQLHEVIDDPEEDDLYLVFELCENGPVMNEAMQPPLYEVRSLDYFVDLLLGMEYLHSRGIIHRDIKPENLLLDDKKAHIKISDFGVSEWFSDLEQDKNLKKTAGSPAFMAPEAVQSTPGQVVEYAGKPADVWAMGVTLYCFVFGELPFKSPCILDLYELIREADLKFPEDIPISDELRDFFSRVLEKDPQKRLDIDGMRKHPWIAHVELQSTEENCKDNTDVSDEEVAEAFKNLTVSELCTVLANLRTGSRKKISMSRAKMLRSQSLDIQSRPPQKIPSINTKQSESDELTKSRSSVSVNFCEQDLIVEVSTAANAGSDETDGQATSPDGKIDFAHLSPQQEAILGRLASPDSRRRSYSAGRRSEMRSRSPSPAPFRMRQEAPAIEVSVASPTATAQTASTKYQF